MPAAPERTSTAVRVQVASGVMTVTLADTENRNALGAGLVQGLFDAIKAANADEDVRVVVITGEGGNFSAGQDLQKFFRDLENDPLERKKAQRAANAWRWDRMINYDKPTIAMIRGYCVGGAFMQLLGTDFAIAAKTATFSLSEVNWGILPGALVSKVVVVFLSSFVCDVLPRDLISSTYDWGDLSLVCLGILPLTRRPYPPTGKPQPLIHFPPLCYSPVPLF